MYGLSEYASLYLLIIFGVNVFNHADRHKDTWFISNNGLLRNYRHCMFVGQYFSIGFAKAYCFT